MAMAPVNTFGNDQLHTRLLRLRRAISRSEILAKTARIAQRQAMRMMGSSREGALPIHTVAWRLALLSRFNELNQKLFTT
jgi:hypothetical protein